MCILCVSDEYAVSEVCRAECEHALEHMGLRGIVCLVGSNGSHNGNNNNGSHNGNNSNGADLNHDNSSLLSNSHQEFGGKKFGGKNLAGKNWQSVEEIVDVVRGLPIVDFRCCRDERMFLEKMDDLNEVIYQVCVYVHKYVCSIFEVVVMRGCFSRRWMI